MIDDYDRNEKGCCEQCSVRADLPDGNDTACGDPECACHTDPDHRPTRDPASLLPYVCEIEPSDPNVERLTGGYSGSNSHSILDADSRNRGI